MTYITEEVEVIRQLNEIRKNGTHFWKNSQRSGDTVPQVGFNHNNILTCSDGFSVSVTAGWGAKGIPNPGWGGFPESYSGPYDSFEVGKPSQLPEPWGLWRLFCSNEGTPTEANYYYVPYVMIEQLLLDHEGFDPEGLSLIEQPQPQPTPAVGEIPPPDVGTFEGEPSQGARVVGGKTLRGVFAYRGNDTNDGESFSSLPKPGGGLGRFYHNV